MQIQVLWKQQQQQQQQHQQEKDQQVKSTRKQIKELNCKHQFNNVLPL